MSLTQVRWVTTRVKIPIAPFTPRPRCSPRSPQCPRKPVPQFVRLASSLPPKPDWRPRDQFDPAELEKGWYEYWESRGHFEPAKDAKRQIRMLLPPPNVTGELHIGHALMVSIQDALARYYRMTGHAVKWSPGTDHAGIATQMVVERMLEQESGMRREDLGRERFEEVVEEWRLKYGRRILDQIKTLGTSATWSREYYTKDEFRSKSVTNAFVKLWDEGLIYRQTRMVNWCVKLQTAVSDIEVVSQEITEPTKIDKVEFGYLWKFAYKVVGSTTGEEIVIATTRPETIPGDRAIAVHPDDPRYKHLHYEYVAHPLDENIRIPIIPDAELVDPKMGTGAVKITPAHDLDDYAFWLRHSTSSPLAAEDKESKRLNIPLVRVYGPGGKMTTESGLPNFIGVDRLAVRKKIVTLLQQKGSYRDVQKHSMRIGICERSGAVIEPMLVPQWYLKMKPLAEKVFEVAKRDGLVFTPEDPHSALWDRWLGGIQDWCLSRQIWWGHRVPAYQVIDPKYVTEERGIVRWLAAENIDAAAAKMTREEREMGCFLRQDVDVLDTWFSSGLLPLSTASWTGKSWSEKKRDNYPLKFIESGGDILFFWLARMALLCTWFTDKLPFNEIILHPLVCDATGRKMSKSVGNVIDPLLIINGRSYEEMVEDLQNAFRPRIQREGDAGLKAASELRNRIKELRKTHPKGFRQSGADSLRMALIDYTVRERQINMEVQRVDFFRKMVVKMENAFKLFYIARGAPWAYSNSFSEIPGYNLRVHDFWLIHKLRTLTETVNKAYETRQLYKASSALRQFIFDDFCNGYLEYVKNEISTVDGVGRRDAALTILTLAWDIVLRLLHPMMPYVTESLWQALAPTYREDAETIMLQKFPTVDSIPEVEAALFEDMQPMLRLISSLNEYKVGKKQVMEMDHYLVLPHGSVGNYLGEMAHRIKTMTKVRGLKPVKEKELATVVNADDQWLVVWAEAARPGWTVWEMPQTGKRLIMWGPESPGTRGSIRSLMDVVEGAEEGKQNKK